jgi:hypothetical protein
MSRGVGRIGKTGVAKPLFLIFRETRPSASRLL